MNLKFLYFCSQLFLPIQNTKSYLGVVSGLKRSWISLHYCDGDGFFFFFAAFLAFFQLCSCIFMNWGQLLIWGETWGFCSNLIKDIKILFARIQKCSSCSTEKIGAKWIFPPFWGQGVTYLFTSLWKKNSCQTKSSRVVTQPNLLPTRATFLFVNAEKTRVLKVQDSFCSVSPTRFLTQQTSYVSVSCHSKIPACGLGVAGWTGIKIV